MSVLTKKQIVKLRDENKIEVEPFSEHQCEPASYDLKLGHILKAGYGKLKLKKGDDASLKGGEWALVMSEEIIRLPLNICATYGLRSSITRKGLMYFGGPQIDPGYEGRLFVSIFNPTVEPIMLRYGDPLFTLIFHHLDKPVSKPYNGRYQGQYDFPSEDVERMMAMKSRTFSEMFTKVDDLDNSVNLLAKNLDILTNDVHNIRKSLDDSKDMMKNLFYVILSVILTAGVGGVAAAIKYLFF